MAFTSIPAAFLDPPAGWNQVLHDGTVGGIDDVGQLPMPLLHSAMSAMAAAEPPQPRPPSDHHHATVAGNSSSNSMVPAGASPAAPRPGSMTERARLAKIPLPEPGLKCPRCDSTNTKFCYFNNYSLTQPRHFCKTCRRYWTRGGALRNVPVGGGCRRNKRSKSSKSGASGAATNSASAASSSTSSTATGGVGGAVPAPPQLPFLASLQLGEYNYGNAGGRGIGFSAAGGQLLEQHQPLEYHQHIGGFEQWRLPPPPPPAMQQQFPFLGRIEAPNVMPLGGSGGGGFPFIDVDAAGGFATDILPKATAGIITQMASVKMEDHNAAAAAALAAQREFLGGALAGNLAFWGGGAGVGNAGGGAGSSGNGAAAAWTEQLSGFNMSSTGSIL